MSIPTVFLIDDDPVVLDALGALIRASGFEVRTFSAPQDFLSQHRPDSQGCLILDIQMPVNGLEFQAELQRKGCHLPVIMMSGDGRVSSCARAFHQGAVDFVEKPVSRADLEKKILNALERDQALRQSRRLRLRVSSALESLTPREGDVFDLMLEGSPTKNIAQKLDITHQTAAKHKASILDKFGATTDAEFVRLVLESGVIDSAVSN